MALFLCLIFSAVKENPEKQLDGGKEDFVFIFELKQKKNHFFFRCVLPLSTV